MTAAELREAVEAGLARALRHELHALPSSVTDPIRYSIDGGGKRVRGMLLLAAYRAAGGAGDASGLAAAVELIHAYSLVHDDLPCMDDDDVRRGRPTAHRVFGIRAATVAGAVMIPLAARIACDSAEELVLPRETGCMIVKVLMRAAGAGGMIGGQLADLDAEGAELAREELDLIHSAKTGALIAASLEIGGLAAGATEPRVRALVDFGSRIGLAFQIMDDVLDVTSSTDKLGKTTGRDVALRKSTYPGLLGVVGATDRANNLVASACRDLRSHEIHTAELEELATFIVSRTH
ncbi:MAG: polyprenyl synthetase family protein [Gemmatimonadota bacterium]|nr:polyprenyl synthetase family protein [Gemmatimonadota bacterium]